MFCIYIYIFLSLSLSSQFYSNIYIYFYLDTYNLYGIQKLQMSFIEIVPQLERFFVYQQNSKRWQISRKISLPSAYPASSFYPDWWNDKLEGETGARRRDRKRGRGRSSGCHVVWHARDNQCNDVIVTVSQSRPIVGLLHSNLPASGSKWKLDEFRRTLARLQFGLDHWEAWIRAVGRAPLDDPFASLSPSDSSHRVVEFVHDDLFGSSVPLRRRTVRERILR